MRGVISRSHRVRVEVVGGRVDVGEDRCDPLPVQRVAVATNVNDGTITSPFMPSARMAISSATVALHIGDAVPHARGSSATGCSNSCTQRAVVGQPAAVEDVVDPTEEASRSPTLGGRRAAGGEGGRRHAVSVLVAGWTCSRVREGSLRQGHPDVAAAVGLGDAGWCPRAGRRPSERWPARARCRRPAADGRRG